jgi:cytidylate kinase
MRRIIVAIDGPSGSGKSTISRRVAADLGLAYLDTGAMYRAATWWCLDRGVRLTDADAVLATVVGMPLEMGTDPLAPTVRVGGTDLAEAIRSTEISSAVSAVATNLAVRAEMRRRQRAIIDGATGRTADGPTADGSSHFGRTPSGAPGRGIVAEGRDITTVVAPEADVRILLTASEGARLARRAREVHGADDAAALAATHDQVIRRDADDSTVSAFHTAADGVTSVDSSDLTLEATVAVVRELVEHALLDGARQ